MSHWLIFQNLCLVTYLFTQHSSKICFCHSALNRNLWMESDLSFNFLCIFCINFGGKTLQICMFLSLRDTWYLYFEVKTEKYIYVKIQYRKSSINTIFLLSRIHIGWIVKIEKSGWKCNFLQKKVHINVQNSLNMNFQEHENYVKWGTCYIY